mgnify:CR=1 FL=1
MYVTTTLDFAGYRIKEYKGVVRGIVVRAPTISQGIMGGLKQIIGGNIGAYTEMCEQARKEAFDLYLGDGRPAYVGSDGLGVEEGISLVRESHTPGTASK